MRLDNQIIQFFKQIIAHKMPGAKVYLFGSRTSDESMGGDIDLMILTDTLVNKKVLRAIRIEFYKKFGWQKLDLVNFTSSDTSVFKQLIQTNAIEL